MDRLRFMIMLSYSFKNVKIHRINRVKNIEYPTKNLLQDFKALSVNYLNLKKIIICLKKNTLLYPVNHVVNIRYKTTFNMLTETKRLKNQKVFFYKKNVQSIPLGHNK